MDQDLPVGHVGDDLSVGCETGAVRLLRLQRAGKGPMGKDEFIRGFAIPKGSVLAP